MKILCILTNGFEEVEAIGTIGILRRGGIDIDIFSLHGTEVTGRYGVTVKNLGLFQNINLDNYDFLLIPGGPQYAELENNPYFIKNPFLQLRALSIDFIGVFSIKSPKS